MSRIRKYLVTFTQGSISVRAAYPKQARERALKLKRFYPLTYLKGRIIKVERA